MAITDKNRINGVLTYLPAHIAEAVAAADHMCCEELRLRVGSPVQLVSAYGDEILEGAVFSRGDAKELLEKLCRHSVYSRAEELMQGYITAPGGARIGVCGRPLTENGRIVSLTDVSC